MQTLGTGLALLQQFLVAGCSLSVGWLLLQQFLVEVRSLSEGWLLLVWPIRSAGDLPRRSLSPGFGPLIEGG